MKEITLRLTNEIADYISSIAKERGLTSEEFMKYIMGTYVHAMKQEHESSPQQVIVGVEIDKLMEDIKDNMLGLVKENLRRKARLGELKCKNCTMAFTEKDVDNGRCGTCGAPLKGALGGSHDSA